MDMRTSELLSTSHVRTRRRACHWRVKTLIYQAFKFHSFPNFLPWQGLRLTVYYLLMNPMNVSWKPTRTSLQKDLRTHYEDSKTGPGAQLLASHT